MADHDQPPARPPALEEHAAAFFLRALAPGRPAHAPAPEPPKALAPFERLRVPRHGRGGFLDATFYPAEGEARGAVLLAHPGLAWAQAYFHRRGRVEALRAAGYHALTFDFSGFGGSSPVHGLWDRDVADALHALCERASGLPLHVWGVSFGGYWTHALLSHDAHGVAGVAFEDVTPHLFEYRTHGRLPPAWQTLATRALIPRARRFMDVRLHAPHLRVRTAAYVAGGADVAIPLADARDLARRAGAPLLVVRDAPHLGAIKRAGRAVIAHALAAFADAERAPRASTPRAGRVRADRDDSP